MEDNLRNTPSNSRIHKKTKKSILKAPFAAANVTADLAVVIVVVDLAVLDS